MLQQIRGNVQKSALLEDAHAVAEHVGLAAIVVQDLKAKRIKVRQCGDIVFLELLVFSHSRDFAEEARRYICQLALSTVL